MLKSDKLIRSEGHGTAEMLIANLAFNATHSLELPCSLYWPRRGKRETEHAEG